MTAVVRAALRGPDLVGQDVRVYRNLHARLWSVLVGGRVVARLPRLALAGVTFVVRPGGAARAAREGRRNVHAFARGTVVETDAAAVTAALGAALAAELRLPAEGRRVAYRLGLGFVDAASGRPVAGACVANLTEDGSCLVY